MQLRSAITPPDDEHPDVREEAREVAGDGWMNAPNDRLGGRTPEQAIDAGEEVLVRDILRSIKHIGVS
jgi:Protein of unknown function (DUF2384)